MSKLSSQQRGGTTDQVILTQKANKTVKTKVQQKKKKNYCDKNSVK